MPTITVDAWTRKTEQRMLAVYRESTRRLTTLMQSRIPVDTGFARASLRASLKEMPRIDPEGRPKTIRGTFSYDPSSVAVVIASAGIGDKIYLGWTANYVEFLERGHSAQAPAGFIRVSALEWPRIVSDTIADAKTRAGS